MWPDSVVGCPNKAVLWHWVFQMTMGISIKAFALSAALAVSAIAGGQAAQAASCQFGDQSQFWLQADVWTSTACVSQIAGNDSDTSAGNNIVNVNTVGGTGLFGTNTWTLNSRYDANGSYGPNGILSISNVSSDMLMGDWAVSSWSGITSAMLVLKAGNGFASYLLDLTAGTIGQWATLALTNNGGNQPAISHISLYTTSSTPPAPVPVPAAGLLLMGALGVLTVARRRRKMM